MKPPCDILKWSSPAWLGGGVLSFILFMTAPPTGAQDEMTHEELMQRARRGLPPSQIATNHIISVPPVSYLPAASVTPGRVPASNPPPASAEVKSAMAEALRLKTAAAAPVITSPPIAPEVDPIPALPAPAPVIPRVAKSKAPVFADLPPDDALFPALVSPTSTAPPPSTASRPVAGATFARSDVGSTNGTLALDEKYLLAIGDRLSFRIVEDEEGPKSLVVTDSGELEVPLIGRFRGVGRTCRELAQALKAEFEKEYYYQATVVIAVDAMTRSRGKVYLVGPVRAPGPLEIPSDEVLTLSKAVLRAGGFTDFADRRNVKVTRKATLPGGADETFTVNVAEILEKGKTDTDLPLEPGDLIYIQERMIRF